MSKLLFALGLLFCVACSDVDDDFEAEQGNEKQVDGGLGMKSQALGTACPARVYTTLSTPDSRFNSSGWEGEWFNYADSSFWGIRACEYNKYSTFFAGYTIGRSCSAIPASNGKGWLCGLNRVDCPDTASVGSLSSYRQSVGGTKVWGTPGPVSFVTPSTGTYAVGSGSFDSVNQRIWCGYNLATTFSFNRPETY